MNAITERAEAKLAELKPPADGCDLPTYRKYVMHWMAGESVSIADLSDLAIYFSCGVADVVDKATRNAFGKG